MQNLALENINSKIFEIRGQKVMLDSDLAKLYNVETSYLNRQVKRNYERFDEVDFMFQLSKEEFDDLKCQNGTSSWGGKRKLPYVFTEQGVYMLATVINSHIAVQITKQIMRTFTALRRFALTYDELAKKIDEIETRVSHGEKRDQQIIDILNQLMAKDDSKSDRIGFIKSWNEQKEIDISIVLFNLQFKNLKLSLDDNKGSKWMI